MIREDDLKILVKIADFKHGISCMLLLIVLAYISSAVGCASVFMGAASDGFRKLMDREVGKNIKQSWVQKYEKQIIDAHNSEYVIRDRGSECVVIFAVDETSGDIGGWRYVSDPSKCKVAHPP